MYKNTASQQWVVFAFQDEGGANPGEPVASDAANITANVRIDAQAANAVDDTNPTELEDGYYSFGITAAESNGDSIVITPVSSTANVNVIGVPGAVYTRTDVSAVEGKIDTVDTEIGVIDGIVDTILLDTAELQGDDVPGLIATVTTDLDDIKGTSFVKDTHSLIDIISDTGFILADTNELQVDNTPAAIAALNDAPAVSAASIADAVWDELQAAHVIADSFGVMASELAAIPTTAMRGTDSAATSAKQDTMETTLNAAATAAALATVDTEIGTIDGIVDTILVDTADMQPKVATLATDNAAGDLGVDVDKINGAVITGDGDATPFDVA